MQPFHFDGVIARQLRFAERARSDGPPAGRRNFADLRILCDRLRANCSENTRLYELSMGMSGDYEVAVEEGTTIVRVGSALFA